MGKLVVSMAKCHYACLACADFRPHVPHVHDTFTFKSLLCEISNVLGLVKGSFLLPLKSFGVLPFSLEVYDIIKN